MINELTFGSKLTQIRCGFRSKKQLNLFVVWKEFYNEFNEVEFACIIFNSEDWISY